MSKKLFSKVFILLLVVGLLFAVAPTKQAMAQGPSVWDGTYPTAKPDDMPAVDGGVQAVTTAAQFAWLSRQADMFPAGVTTVKLMVDIDLANHPWTPSGGLASGSAAGGNIFDGNGRTISNLNAGQVLIGGFNFSALFVGANGGAPIIQNLVINGAVVEATGFQSYAAVVVATNDFGGDFINVTVKNATVKATKYAGVVSSYSSSYDDGANFTNCSVENSTLIVQEMLKPDSSVNLPHVGGIVGLMNVGTMSGCTVSDLAITVLPVSGQPIATNQVGTLIGTAQASVLVGTNNVIGDTYNGVPFTKIVGLDNRTYKVVNATQMIGYTTIQAAINAAVDGDTIQVAAGTYEETVDIIDKDLTLIGQPGAIIKSPVEIPARTGTSWKAIVFVHHSNATIDGFTIDGAGRGNLNSRFLGVQFFEADGVLKNSTVTNVTWTPFNGAQEGIGFYAYNETEPARSVSLQDNTFVNNQKGDVNIYGSPLNVIIEGNTFTGRGNTDILAQNGVTFQGGATGSVQDNSFSGYSYSKEPPDQWNWGAAGLLLYGAGDVTLGGGNNFTGNDNHLYIYDSGSVVMGAETFGASTSPIDFGYFVVNSNDAPLNLTQSTFPTTDPFELAVRIWDGIDEAGNGLARFEAGNVYVNVDGSIQRAIDLATEGDIIHVAAGTYAELLKITKPLTLLGPNAGIDGTTGTRNPEALITFPEGDNSELSLIDAKSNDINVNGFSFTNNQIENTYSGGWDLILVGENIEFVNNRVISRAKRKIAFKIQGPFTNSSDPANNYDGAVVKNNYFESPNTSWNTVIVQGIGATVKYNSIIGGTSGIQIQPYTNTAGGIVSQNNITGYVHAIWHNYQVDGNGLWIYENNILGAPIPPTTFYGYGKGTYWQGIVVQTHTPNIEVRNNTINGENDDYTLDTGVLYERTSLGVSYYSGLYAASQIYVHDNEFVNVDQNVENLTTTLGDLDTVFANNTFEKSAYVENGYLIYTSIQDAIDAAADGDTILVGPGTYVETVNVNKDITLDGATDPFGSTPAVVQGLITISAQGATVQDLKVTPGSVVGQVAAVSVYASNTTVSGNLIDGMAGDNTASVKGIFVYGGSTTALQNITISGNTVKNISNPGTLVKGTDGIQIQGNLIGVNVSNNIISAISSQGWAYGIEVTPSGANPTLPPQDVVVTGNTISNVTAVTYPGVALSIDQYNAENTADASKVTAELNRFNALPVVNKDSAHSLNAERNWWGSAAGPAAGQLVGAVSYLPYCLDPECTQLSQAKLSMDPATIDAATCGQQYVDVVVANVADLTAYTMEVTFDQTKVRIDSVENRGLFTETTEHSVVPVLDDLGNTTGRLIFGAYLQDKSPDGNPGPVTSASGTLMRIYYTPLLGSTTFTVDGAKSLLIGWPEVNPMPFSVTGGATATLTGGVVRNTNTSTNYCSLASAVADAGAGHKLQLLTDLTIPAMIPVNKALTLDLNGKTATVPAGGAALHVTTAAGALNITDSTPDALGKITGGDRAVQVSAGGALTLTKGTLEGTGFDGVFVYGEGSSVTVNGGTITGLYYGISGNGSAEYAGATAITINGGAVQGGETAIFHPEEGLLKITGGTITGGSYNGIEMKAGDLEITGGTITTSAAYVANPAQTSNGNTQSGDAILIYNRNGYGAGQTMDVTITGGTITSTNGYALREYTFTGETSRLGVATVSGGSFTGGTPGAVSFSTNNATNLEVIGGDYSANPAAFVYTPYFAYQSGSRWYIAYPPAITGSTPAYYLVGEEGASTITITNPPLGAPYGNTIVFDLTIANADLDDITSAVCTYAGIPLDIKALLVDTGTDLTARLGGLDGFFEVTPDFSMTIDCTMTYATAKAYAFTSEMVHVVGTTEYTVATNTATVNVYDKPTITFQLLDKYFLTGDPQNFQVTVDNPITGGTYGHVAFQISIPAAAGDITSLKYLGTALTLDCTTTSGVCTTVFDLGVVGGIPLAPSQGSPWLLELTAAKAGTYPMTFTLVDLDSNPDRNLQSATGTATVYNKPVITAPLLSGPFNAGVPATVTVNVNNVDLMFTPNAFNLYFTFPEGTVYEYDGVSYTCTLDEDLGNVVCPPIPVTLVAGANALSITITFPGAYNAPITVGLWGSDDVGLATYTTPANVVVNGDFTVTGNFSMQGNLSRAGVPVTFTWTGDLVSYGPTGYSTAVSGTNFSQVLTYGGSYTITTLQPRYLNVYAGAGFSKMINLTGDRALPELRLRGGNAYWRVVDESNAYTNQYDNTVNGSDASVVGTDWNKTFSVQDLTINCGDVNFDGKVNIQDLALVGGNFGLTSADAYEAWLQ